MSLDLTQFKAYLGMGVATIPCIKFFDEQKNIYTGKRPAIKEWEKYSRELPTEDEIDSWGRLKNVWGMAIVCGPASNLCCVDIDTEDEEMQKRIIDYLPYSPILIRGDKKRYGKLIYRISDDIIPENYSFTKTKIIDPYTKKSIVDFFFSNAYICIPPSLHSCNASETEFNWYSFDKIEIDSMVLKNLPVLEPAYIDKVRMAVSNIPKKQINETIQTNTETEEIAGRWQQIVHLASNLIRDRVEFDKAIAALLKFDEINFKEAQYFLDKTKGNTTISPRINAYKFYSDMLVSVNRKKSHELELELPTLPEYVEASLEEWGELIPFEKRVNSGQFQDNWMPGNVREIVKMAADATSVDPAMVYFYMLSTFSAMVGNKIIIQPYKQNLEYTESCNLYVGLVAKSGERKSETTKLAKRPLLKIQKELISNVGRYKLGADIECEHIEIRIAKIKTDIRREIAAHGLSSPNVKAMEEEIENLKRGKPQINNLSVYEQENTAECYFQIVEQNPKGIFLEFNEWGSMYEHLQDRDQSKLRRFLLDGWDGQHPFSYKTKGNGENYIDQLCLSVGFCAQEDVISKIFIGLINAQRINDGLMQRFLLVLSDNVYRDVTDSRVVFPDSIFNLFRTAYGLQPAQERLLLDDDAYEIWMAFLKHNQGTKQEEMTSMLESFYSKFDGLSIRLAGLTQIIENEGNIPQMISGAAMSTAIQMIEYFRTNIKSIMQLSEQSILHEIVRLYAISAIPEELSLRDMYRQYPALFGYKAEIAIKRLRALADHNYIKITKAGKSYRVIVNPAIKRN